MNKVASKFSYAFFLHPSSPTNPLLSGYFPQEKPAILSLSLSLATEAKAWAFAALGPPQYLIFFY